MSGDIFELDQGDRETLRGTLHDPAATVGDVLTVQPDKSIAAQPGGGGSGGMQVIRFPFTFADAAALADGIEIFTPEAGGLIYDAGIVILHPFNGTTPNLDIGYFNTGASGMSSDIGGTPIDATQAVDPASGSHDLLFAHSPLWLQEAALQGGADGQQIYVAGAAPFLVVGSQDGTKGGTPLNSTTGAAIVHVLYAPPTP